MSETVKKKSSKKIAVILICSVILAAILVLVSWTAWWSNRHAFITKVDSITAYQYEDNKDYYRFEIKGTVKNWYYDFKTHENVSVVGYLGGEPMFSNIGCDISPVTVSKRPSEFLIVVDVDRSSNKWGSIDEFIYNYEFHTPDASSLKYFLFMSDNKDVEITWEEPQPVTDSLLSK